MNQPKDGKKLKIAVVASVEHNPFIKAMLDVGLLPVNCRRFVIDSGTYGEDVMTIYFDCYVDDRIMEEPVIRSLSELKAIVDKDKK